MSTLSINETSSLAFAAIPPTAVKPTHLQWAVAQIATPRFQMLQRICFFGYGLKVFLCDGPSRNTPTTQGTIPQRIYLWGVEYFRILRDNIENMRFNIVHGALFMGSGFFGAIAVLQQFEIVNLGPLFKLFESLEMGLFLTGCVYALIKNLNNYRIADAIIGQGTTAEQRRHSAVLGIVSNLCYIFWGALYMYGFATAHILFCLVGLATGGLKIVYDYLKQIESL